MEGFIILLNIVDPSSMNMAKATVRKTGDNKMNKNIEINLFIES